MQVAEDVGRCPASVSLSELIFDAFEHSTQGLRLVRGTNAFNAFHSLVAGQKRLVTSGKLVRDDLKLVGGFVLLDHQRSLVARRLKKLAFLTHALHGQAVVHVNGNGMPGRSICVRVTFKPGGLGKRNDEGGKGQQAQQQDPPVSNLLGCTRIALDILEKSDL